MRPIFSTTAWQIIIGRMQETTTRLCQRKEDVAKAIQDWNAAYEAATGLKAPQRGRCGGE